MDHHKRVLVLLAIARFHSPVILLDLEVKTFQPVGQRLDRFDCRRVDDADALGNTDKNQELQASVI